MGYGNRILWVGKKNSLARINELSSYLNEKMKVQRTPFDLQKLSIYCTGSYGRLEARTDSDMDILAIVDNISAGQKIDSLSFHILKGWVIEWMREKGIKDLDSDGEYFQPQNLSDILSLTGAKNDDSDNTFTSRMLLLFEGRAIFNEPVFAESRKKIVSHYFRDAAKTDRSFRPTFLINDLVRYWRTICLNYEFKRTKYLKNSEDIQNERNKVKLKLQNKKLKFHRIWLCYSAIIPLLKEEFWSETKINEMINKSPIERFEEACGMDCATQFSRSAQLYSEFINEIRDLNESYSDVNWELLNGKAERFRENVLEVIEKVCDKKARSYLLV